MNKIYAILLILMFAVLGKGLICNFTSMKYYSFSKCQRNSASLNVRGHQDRGIYNPGPGFCLPLIFDEESYYNDHLELKVLNDKIKYDKFINDLKLDKNVSNENIIYFLNYKRFKELNFQSVILKEQKSNLKNTNKSLSQNEVKLDKLNQSYFTSDNQLAVNELIEQLKKEKKYSNNQLLQLFDATK